MWPSHLSILHLHPSLCSYILSTSSWCDHVRNTRVGLSKGAVHSCRWHLSYVIGLLSPRRASFVMQIWLILNHSPFLFKVEVTALLIDKEEISLIYLKAYKLNIRVIHQVSAGEKDFLYGSVVQLLPLLLAHTNVRRHRRRPTDAFQARPSTSAQQAPFQPFILSCLSLWWQAFCLFLDFHENASFEQDLATFLMEWLFFQAGF